MRKKVKEEQLELQEEISELKQHVVELAEVCIDKLADSTKKLPHDKEELTKSIEEHPFMTLGLAALAGFILGLLIKKN